MANTKCSAPDENLSEENELAVRALQQTQTLSGDNTDMESFAKNLEEVSFADMYATTSDNDFTTKSETCEICDELKYQDADSHLEVHSHTPKHIYEDNSSILPMEEVELCEPLENITVGPDSDRHAHHEEPMNDNGLATQNNELEKFENQFELVDAELGVQNPQQHFSSDSGVIDNDYASGGFELMPPPPQYEEVTNNPDSEHIVDVHDDTAYFRNTQGNEETGVIMENFEIAEPEVTTTAWRVFLNKKLLMNIGVPAFNMLVGLVVGLSYFISSIHNESMTGHENSYTLTGINLTQLEDLQIQNMYSGTYDNGEVIVALNLALGASIGALFAAVTMRIGGLMHALARSTCVIFVGLILQMIDGGHVFKILTHLLCGSALGYGTSTSIVWMAENSGPMTSLQMFSLIPFFVTLGMLSTYCKPVGIILLLISLYVYPLLASFKKSAAGQTQNPSPERHGVRGIHTISGMIERTANVLLNPTSILTAALEPFWSPSFYRPALIICTMEVLQQLSGTVCLFFLAFKLFQEYSCQLDVEMFSFYITLSSVGLSSVFCICLNLSKIRRGIFLASHLVVMIFNFLVLLMDYKLLSEYGIKEIAEELKCMPGMLACITSMIALTWALPLPVLTCSEMFTKLCRTVGTGICIAAACLSLTIVLAITLWAPGFFSFGHHLALLVFSLVSLLSFLFSLCFLLAQEYALLLPAYL